MEKLYVGWQMSTRWTDPTLVLFMLLPICIGWIWGTGYSLYYECYRMYLPVPSVIVYIIFQLWMWDTEEVNTKKYIVFHDKALEAKYGNRRYPMSELVDDFINSKVSFNKKVEKGDCWKILQFHRQHFVSYKVGFRQIKWLLSQFIPPFLQFNGLGYGNSSVKDKKHTKKEIAEHYDRGNDFFNAFMGPTMVYTSGVFHGLHQTLEQAQFNKMQLICEKLQLKENETFLDIGCGWGTLTRHAVKEFGAVGTGVTLSVEGKKWCDMKNDEENVETEILCRDYRDIPKDRRFNKISSIEMAEHVGLANFVDPYLSGVYRLLEDDGIFLMQVAGLRQGSNWEDVAWGLFMSRYIFPGADASTPLNWYIRQLEVSGFEVHSVETIGRHYSHTLHKWYDNWMSNKKKIMKNPKYGEGLFRLWEIFLAWSVIAAGQGSATCYQIACHKNKYDFPRDRWCESDTVSDNAPTGVGISKKRSKTPAKKSKRSKTPKKKR